MVDRIVSASNKDEARTPDEQAAYEERMVKVADEGTTHIRSTDSRTGEETNLEQSNAKAETEVATRPDDIPEKFWDAEKGEVNVSALLKAQQDAEAALRRTQQEGKAEKQSDPQQEAATTEGNVTEQAAAEFAERGELSEDTYVKLEGVGISREMVNQYIAGQQAIVSDLQDAAYGELGGEAEYAAAVEWASNNLEADQIEALNVQLTSLSKGVVKAGAQALAALYRADQPVDPRVTIQGGGNVSSGSYYKSGTEMRTDMADPRYARDPAFRQEVQDKIARADRAGVDLFK